MYNPPMSRYLKAVSEEAVMCMTWPHVRNMKVKGETKESQQYDAPFKVRANPNNRIFSDIGILIHFYINTREG